MKNVGYILLDIFSLILSLMLLMLGYSWPSILIGTALLVSAALVLGITLYSVSYPVKDYNVIDAFIVFSCVALIALGFSIVIPLSLLWVLEYVTIAAFIYAIIYLVVLDN